MLHVVNELRPERHHRLWVRFADGVEGIVDTSALIARPVFAALADEGFFAQAQIDEWGVVCWPNGADLAPDAMHDALQKHGLWRPGPAAGSEAA